ncbi:hypothetical protein CBL_13317 [Carabus blaptoides fortunei]
MGPQRSHPVRQYLLIGNQGPSGSRVSEPVNVHAAEHGAWGPTDHQSGPDFTILEFHLVDQRDKVGTEELATSNEMMVSRTCSRPIGLAARYRRAYNHCLVVGRYMLIKCHRPQPITLAYTSTTTTMLMMRRERRSPRFITGMVRQWTRRHYGLACDGDDSDITGWSACSPGDLLHCTWSFGENTDDKESQCHIGLLFGHKGTYHTNEPPLRGWRETIESIYMRSALCHPISVCGTGHAVHFDISPGSEHGYILSKCAVPPSPTT